MRLLQEDSIGLVIDIQEKLLPHINAFEDVVKNTRKLIDGLSILGVNIIVTEQYRKGLGGTVPEIADKIEGFSSYEKSTFSCCDDHGFIEELNRSGKRNVLIAGIESHVCVLQTAVDLIELGYRPVIVADCTSSRKESDYLIAIERMRQEGAIISTYESLLFELARVSGTEQFKGISKIVK